VWVLKNQEQNSIFCGQYSLYQEIKPGRCFVFLLSLIIYAWQGKDYHTQIFEA